jgi:spore coat polysaccharide biosynthesis protein SpsF
MKKKIIAIVEARTNSKRLKNKVLKKINGKEIITLILQRLKVSKKIDQIVVATTNNKDDDKIIKVIGKEFDYFRGSEKNVLKRVIGAADKFKANLIVRITADNPIVDVKAIDYMINFYLKNLHIDYLTNNFFGDLNKRKLALGLDISIFKKDKLELVKKYVQKLKKNKNMFCEFPTLYFYTIGKYKFNIKNITLPERFLINKKFRLTVDTENDLKFFISLFSHFKNKKNYLDISDIKKVLLKNPKLANINNKIAQFQPNFDE